MHDSSKWPIAIASFISTDHLLNGFAFERLKKQMDMIWQHAPRKQLIKRAVMMVEIFTDEFSDVRFFQPPNPITTIEMLVILLEEDFVRSIAFRCLLF